MRHSLAILVLLSAFGWAQGTAKVARPPTREPEHKLIANVEQWNDRPFELLVKAGFKWPGGDGGRGIVAVRVPVNEAARAYRLLTEDCKKKGYWLYIQNPKGKWESYNKQNPAAYDAWVKRLGQVGKRGKSGG